MKIVSKIISSLAIVILFVAFGQSQNKYANEWINPTSTYYKMKVNKTGIYQVTFEQLAEKGFPTNVKGSQLKLINFGQEQAIYVSSDNFGPGSYIEFFGEKNTIGLDSVLYKDWKTDLFNPYYSFVNDDNAYYLTISPNTSNLRYTQINPNFGSNNLTAEEYYLHEELTVFNSTYFKNTDGSTRYSHFEPSEGFGTELVRTSTNTINVSSLKNSGPKPKLSFRLGRNNVYSKLDITWNGEIKETFVFPATLNSQHDYELNASEIANSNKLIINSNQSALDMHRISYISLTYPRAFDFKNASTATLTFEASTGKRFFEMDNFNSSSDVFAYDPKNNIKYATFKNGNKIGVIINAQNAQNKIYVADKNLGTLKPSEISIFEPTSFANEGQEYVIIYNKALQKLGGRDVVQEYADYRASNEGGGYKMTMIEIQDIYDHFGYGIDRHFVGVKNLANYMHDQWPEAKFVLLLGKGVEFPYMRSNNDLVNNLNSTFFIPTFGYLGSDNMMFSEKNYPDSYFALGRIAAKSAEDISNYLDKVKEYDLAPLAPQTIEDKYWMKKVLHLGGGSNDSEQAQIRHGLESFAQIISDTLFGGDITSFYKKSSNPVLFADNQEINSLFNNGIGILNFFGHSASSTWEFAIENPRNYDNFGKYPLINSFGCYSGNLHGVAKGISEAFVLEKNRGAISFFASTGTAGIFDLSIYGTAFYNLSMHSMKSKKIGEIIKYIATTNRHDSIKSKQALYAQLTFHGDPALGFNLFEASDYVFDYTSIKTEPKIVQNSLPSYEITLDLVNIGADLKDSVDLVFYHATSDLKVVDTIYLKVEHVSNKRSISIPLKNYGPKTVGKNYLLVKLIQNKIKETPDPDAENNNEIGSNGVVGYEYFVGDNYATPIYPPEFAMINTPAHFVLKASTSTAPVTKSNYIFQIDTTEYFNSPKLEIGEVVSEGGYISFLPKSQLIKNTVYYWRISPDSVAGSTYKWSNSSFIYLPEEKEGWNQSHYFQYTKDEFSDFEISEETSRRFVFGKEYHVIKLRNSIWNEEDKSGYSHNNVLFGSSNAWKFMDAGIGIIINNQTNFWEPAVPPGGNYGSLNPTNANITVYAFKTDTKENRKLVMDFIENHVTEGKYMSLYTIQKTIESDYKPHEWAEDSIYYGKSIFTVLEKMGAKDVRKLENVGSVPYILQLFNGKLGLLGEKMALDLNQAIEFQTEIYNLYPKGQLLSTIVGPSTKWDEVKFKQSENTGQKEKSWVNLYGINAQGKEIKLDSNLVQNFSIQVDAKEYPFLRLESGQYDTLDRSAPQLNFWRTSYSPLPDAAIIFDKIEPNPNTTTVNQGEKVKVYYGIENVNYVDMDSILVKYSYIGSSNQLVTEYKKLGKLLANQKLTDVFEFVVSGGNTDGLQFVIEINPDNDQPELYHFNNTISKQIGVAKDNLNPLLNVLFDGIQIMDGDIVSPKPEITILLEDDNTFLPITDPNLFEIKLDTGNRQIVEIPINGPNIYFTPASINDATAKIKFTPTLTEGEYKLIVQGKDASGNKSGINPRTIGFTVIEKQSVSNVLNYPNPFSNSTQFIFTLTGEVIPEIMSISILTLSGKVVKEITKDELGPLHIGINRTEYKWDGTDEYGSKLANGVYLYKVNVRKSGGEKYDQFTNSKTDGFFKEGFGKMVILR